MTPTCEGCGGPPIFLAEVRLPDDSTVRVCSTCTRRIRDYDTRSVQVGDPRHSLHLLREMPRETRSRIEPVADFYVLPVDRVAKPSKAVYASAEADFYLAKKRKPCFSLRRMQARRRA